MWPYFGMYLRASLEPMRKRFDSLLDRLRSIFHWSFSGVVIPASFGAGVSMAFANKFPLAYAFFIVFGGWTLLYWLTSETLKKRRQALLGDPLRWRKYLALEWGISLVIIAGTAILISWTVEVKHTYQRDDVYQHLTFDHSIDSDSQDDPMHTYFTVSNGGSFIISKNHQLVCYTALAVGNSGTSQVQNVYTSQTGEKQFQLMTAPFKYTSSKDKLIPGGDAESGQCLRFYGFANGTDCADITLIFWYQLEAQTGIDQEKRIRMVAYKGKDGKFTWRAQPIQHEGNYCGGFYKQ